MQLAHAALQHGKALGNYCQSLPIVIFCQEIGVTSSAPVLETASCSCKTWPTSRETIRRFTSADNGMVCWICSDQLEKQIRTRVLHEKLGIISVPEEIRWRGFKLAGLTTSREVWPKVWPKVWPRRVNSLSATSLEWSYHKRPQRSQHQERSCWWTGRVAKGIYAKKNTIAKCDPSEVDKHHKDA